MTATGGRVLPTLPLTALSVCGDSHAQSTRRRVHPPLRVTRHGEMVDDDLVDAEIDGHVVRLLRRDTRVVERSFRFADRVLDAVLTHFVAEGDDDANEDDGIRHNHGVSKSERRRQRRRRRNYQQESSVVVEHARTGRERAYRPPRRLHLCVLARADCVHIYAPDGDEVFEVTLPFHADRLLASRRGGLVLQRRSVMPSVPSAAAMAVAFSPPAASASTLRPPEPVPQPRFFTLQHPLDEVKPLALCTDSLSHFGSRSTRDAPRFLTDPALQVVDVCGPLSCASTEWLVCFHTADRRFFVYALTIFTPEILEHEAPRAAPKTSFVSSQSPSLLLLSPTEHRRQEQEKAKSQTAAQSAHLEPDKAARLVWTSPCMDAVARTATTPAATTRAAPTTQENSSAPSFAAFVASDDGRTSSDDCMDDEHENHLLCLFDGATGVLVLKTMGEGLQSWTAVDPVREIRALRCRAATPIMLPFASRQRCIERVDVVLEAMDGQLVLLCGGVQTATLVGPQPTTTPNSVRLEPAAFGTLSITEPQGVVWRCQHPLSLSACSSACALIWDALACSLPSESYIQLRLATLLSSTHRRPPSLSLPISDRWMAAFASVVTSAITTSFLSPQSSSSNESPPRDFKKPRNSIQSTPDIHPALAAMNASTFARLYQHDHAMVLAPLDSVFDSQDAETARTTVAPFTASAHIPKLSVPMLETLVTSLHLTHEELLLSLSNRASVKELGALLGHLSAILHLQRLRAYYHRQQVVLHWDIEPSSRVDDEIVQAVSRLDNELSRLDILQSLQSMLQSDITHGEEEDDDDDAMMLSSSSWSLPSSDAWDDCALFSKHESDSRSPFRRMIALRRIFRVLFVRRSAVVESDWALDLLNVLTSDPLGVALDMSDLPVGIRLPLLDAIRVIRESPPPGITPVMSRLVGRFDLDNDLSTAAASSRRPDGLRELRPMDSTTTTEDRSHCPATDGLTEMVSTCQHLFPHDQRLKEVARLLRSSRPLCLKLEKTPDMTDQDFVAQQQARLLLLCKRSMALSVARGMVTLGTLDASSVETHAWHLGIPALPLAGRTPPTNAIVALDVSGYAKELTHWPQFHNGCATALRLPTRDAAMGLVTRYWVKYHRPSARDFAVSVANASANAGANTSGTTSARPHSLHQNARDLEEAQASHAGLLLGLGLKGHLRCLSMADVYNYLSLSNEFITVAILLGMAATAAHSRRRRRQRKVAQVLRRRRPTTLSTGSQGNSQSSVNGNDDDDDAMIAPSQEDPLRATDDLEIESSQPAPAHPEQSTEEKPANSTGATLELSLERSVSKMLCLHIPSLLPAPFAEFSVPASTQTAALLGLGILYQGTGHRLMTELLLAEITRAPSTVQYGAPHSGVAGASPAATPFDQLEGYSLAAGLALGLVVLGRGRTTQGDPGLADLALEDRLSKLIVGGAQAPNPTRGGSGGGSCLYRGRQWKPLGSGRSSSLTSDERQSSDEAKTHGNAPSEQVNVAVTAGGSALALAFMYLKSGNRSIASLLAVPDTLRLLDYVRPDLLLLRTLAKNLVMWDSIEPSIAWVETKEIPLQLRETYRMIRGATSTLPDDVDIRGVCEAYANIIAGACFGIGLRFAGTGNSDARDTVRHFVCHFRDMRAASSLLGGDVVAAATERATIERCLAVCAQALALVDAGTGDVDTLTLLRSINLRQRAEAELTYGNHMALSMAIGLLFLGGGRGTVSRSSDAIAMLIVALYPMAAMNTADNKYHLQAFRHLYALAVDSSRLVETVDTSTRENCSVTIKLAIRREHHDHINASPSWETRQTPCLLPDLATIDRIVIQDPAFYPVEIVLDGSASEQSRHIANIGRIRTLLEKNKVLLQRRPHANGNPDELPGIQEIHGMSSSCRGSSANLNVTINQYLDVDAARIARSTEASVAWWAERHRQLRTMTLAVDDVQGLHYASYISIFYQLYRLQHPVFPFDSSSQLRQLQLIGEYYNVDPFRLWSTASQRDVVHWLRDQAEESLRDLWRHTDPTTMRFTSSAAAEIALITAESSPKWWATSTEAFLLAAVMQHFDAPPDVWNDPESWRRRMRAALVIATREKAAFGFDAFAGASTREQRTMRSLVDTSLSPREQAFWLRLVSFFLFST
ncbi:hypothetical protein PINS_up003726 [Pythium insidiosum]|nr:hypothetical protein PINS_up003726 [Pythium insidiosum]